jgi:hypothetical protein
METTMLPAKGPAERKRMFVLYIGTFTRCSTWRGASPFLSSSPSHEKEHPSRNDTKSSVHTSVTLLVSSTTAPSRHTRYFGRSVRRSDPGASRTASKHPGLVLDAWPSGVRCVCVCVCVYVCGGGGGGGRGLSE